MPSAPSTAPAPEGPAVPAPKEPAEPASKGPLRPLEGTVARVRDAALSTAAAYCRPRFAAAACDCRQAGRQGRSGGFKALGRQHGRQAVQDQGEVLRLYKGLLRGLASDQGRQAANVAAVRGASESKLVGGLQFDSLEATSDRGRAFGGLQGQVEDSDVVGIELAGFRDTSYGSWKREGAGTPDRRTGRCGSGQTGRWAVVRRAGRQASVGRWAEATSGKTRYSGPVCRYSGGQAGAVGGWANGQDGKGNGQGNGQASVADRQAGAAEDLAVRGRAWVLLQGGHGEKKDICDVV
ncbi:hypothetical protein GGX14DRAFT_390132 [Mycena pura]|uniref:Uncharacterized protein n=1 Tax=Mycena pura TaxID=153505 RepID=A0AAD6YK49_9AGAR|nr:hypothetical protein GGX14DRAFT_390132 [Mycena pura]